MKKKKTVKATPKKVKAKVALKKSVREKSAKANPSIYGGAASCKLASADTIQDKILIALDRLLEVTKAQLYDAFKQYLEHRMISGLPATLEEFIALFTNSYAIHGITDTELFNSVDDHAKEYLRASAKMIETGKKSPLKGATTGRVSGTEANPSNSPKSDVTKEKGVTKIQSEQAAKIDPNEFSLATPTPAATKVTEVATGNESTFGALDIL